MKIITPQRSILISIIALIGAVSMLVVVTFAWFVYLDPSLGGPPLKVVTSNCEAQFIIDGNALSNPNDLKIENIVPGQRLKIEIIIKNTSNQLGFLYIKFKVGTQEFTIDTVENGIKGTLTKKLRDAFAIVTYDKDENGADIDIINGFQNPDENTTDVFTIFDGLSMDAIANKHLFFDIMFRETVGDDDMNIYQGKMFKIETISISVTTKQGTDI